MTTLGAIAMSTPILNRSGTHATRIGAAHTGDAIYRETDTGLVYQDDGTNWNILNPTGVIRKTAAETVNNSAALQNDDHLFFPVEANEQWFAELFLRVTSPSINSDLQVGFTAPASATASWGLAGPNGSWANAVTGATTGVAEKLIANAATVGGAAGNWHLGILGWFYIAGTAGNVQFQWAQGTATAENTQLLTSSFMRITRLV